ncbi:VOC family protein [Gammaproteobacteria bacterium]|nr:VOC family protein [Gammaproteobacteria bacterium]
MTHHHINYIEFAAADLDAIKQFYGTVFDWQFTDYGSEYVAFHGAGVDGGFYQESLSSDSDNGAALVVLFSDDIDATMAAVEAAGGSIKRSLFDFPGGRRFHFIDPAGNELAVWALPLA